MASVIHRRWSSRLLGVLVVMAEVGVLGEIALATYSASVLRPFARAEVRRTTLLYASRQRLSPGVHVGLADLAGALGRLGYVETRTAPSAPGQFRRTAKGWDIVLLGQKGGDLPRGSRLHLALQGERITRVTHDGRDVRTAAIEGELLTAMDDRRGQDHRPVRLADTPRTLVNAVLAAEDHRFFEHGPLDWRGVVRAAWTNLRTGRIAQGGSTLTQQLVKSRLLDPKRTVLRKAQEAWLAMLIEQRYSKDQILEAYLTEIDLGQRGVLAIRGVGAGALAYFGKSVHQLSTGEAALLAAMVRAPNAHSPASNPMRARERRDAVLARMLELRMLSEGEYDRARREPVRAPVDPTPGRAASSFADYVRQEVELRFDDGTLGVQAGGWVLTTLDPTLQRFADRAVERGLTRLEAGEPRLRRPTAAGRLQAALVALDPATGEIRALVGGRDYETSQFNRAVMARRQPGSAFKPFV